MPSTPSAPVLLVAMLILLLAALFPLRAATLSPSHDPSQLLASQSVRHANAGLAIDAATDHVHGDVAIEEASAGHQHGHAAADHSHESPMPPRDARLPLRDRAAAWRAHQGWTAQPVHPSRLERPPKDRRF